GMATKEAMVTSPVIILLYDWIFLDGKMWREVNGYFVALAATWVLLAWVVVRSGAERGGTAGFGTAISPWTYLLTQAQGLTHYVRLALWPAPLVFDYGDSVVRSLTLVWPQAIFITIALLIFAIAVQRRRAFAFCGAGFFVVLAPS